MRERRPGRHGTPSRCSHPPLGESTSSNLGDGGQAQKASVDTASAQSFRCCGPRRGTQGMPVGPSSQHRLETRSMSPGERGSLVYCAPPERVRPLQAIPARPPAPTVHPANPTARHDPAGRVFRAKIWPQAARSPRLRDGTRPAPSAPSRRAEGGLGRRRARSGTGPRRARAAIAVPPSSRPSGPRARSVTPSGQRNQAAVTATSCNARRLTAPDPRRGAADGRRRSRVAGCGPVLRGVGLMRSSNAALRPEDQAERRERALEMATGLSAGVEDTATPPGASPASRRPGRSRRPRPICC